MLAESPMWNRMVLFKHMGTLDCPRAPHVLSVALWWPCAICCRMVNGVHGAGVWKGISTLSFCPRNP